MANNLEIYPNRRVQNIRPIVSRVVMCPWTWRAVACTACFKGRGVEGIDLFFICFFVGEVSGCSGVGVGVGSLMWMWWGGWEKGREGSESTDIGRRGKWEMKKTGQIRREEGENQNHILSATKAKCWLFRIFSKRPPGVASSSTALIPTPR